LEKLENEHKKTHNQGTKMEIANKKNEIYSNDIKKKIIFQNKDIMKLGEDLLNYLLTN